MKKFAKLSLVAAVAVAGLSTANASSLEEAIKGVDVSGMVRYRFTETKMDNMNDMQENDYDIELTAKIPVNDNVKAIVKLDVDGDLSAETDKAIAEGELADGKPSVNVEDAYFSYTNSGFVVNVGKQDVPGPLVDDLQGTGIVALAPVGPVTFAAGYFNGHSFDKRSAIQFKDAYEVGLLASFQNVNLAAWYVDVDETADAWNLSADATLGPVALAVSYAEKDMDGNDNEYQTLKLTAGAEFGMFDVHAGYAQNGEDGTGELQGGNDAAVNDFGGEQVDITTFNDQKVFNVGAAVSPTESVTVGLDYYNADGENDNDADEVLFTAAYKMSKNFKISTFYSVAEKNDVDSNKGRLELKYTF